MSLIPIFCFKKKIINEKQKNLNVDKQDKINLKYNNQFLK